MPTHWSRVGCPLTGSGCRPTGSGQGCQPTVLWWVPSDGVGAAVATHWSGVGCRPTGSGQGCQPTGLGRVPSDRFGAAVATHWSGVGCRSTGSGQRWRPTGLGRGAVRQVRGRGGDPLVWGGVPFDRFGAVVATHWSGAGCRPTGSGQGCRPTGLGWGAVLGVWRGYYAEGFGSSNALPPSTAHSCPCKNATTWM